MTDRTDGPSAAIRIRVLKRDRFRCTYCGASGNDHELEIDHIIPVARGGSHHISNLTTACFACNRSKGDRNAPSRAASATPSSSSGLVGLFVHTRNADGRIQYEGRIVGVHGDDCLVQLFSAIDGSPTKITALPSDLVLRSDLYASNESMVRAMYLEMDRRGELCGSVEDNVEHWRLMNGID